MACSGTTTRPVSSTGSTTWLGRKAGTSVRASCPSTTSATRSYLPPRFIHHFLQCNNSSFVDKGDFTALSGANLASSAENQEYAVSYTAARSDPPCVARKVFLFLLNINGSNHLLQYVEDPAQLAIMQSWKFEHVETPSRNFRRRLNSSGKDETFQNAESWLNGTDDPQDYDKVRCCNL